jgi:hypothetical protein
MHAAADCDDSDNGGGDMELMMMAEGEMKDKTERLPTCQLPWTTLPPSAYH